MRLFFILFLELAKNKKKIEIYSHEARIITHSIFCATVPLISSGIDESVDFFLHALKFIKRIKRMRPMGNKRIRRRRLMNISGGLSALGEDA